MKYYTLFNMLIAVNSYGSLPPPLGKSVRSDNQYTIEEKSLAVFDVTGRLDQRNRLIAEAEEKAATATSDKHNSNAKKKMSKATHTGGGESIKMTRSSAELAQSNLPSYYSGIDRSAFKSSDKAVYVPQNSVVKLGSVKTGDIFHAVIEQRIKSSPSVATPIRAMVTSGGLSGGFFVGEATLDRELKRILLSFNKVRSRDGKTYNLKAAGLSTEGSVGLEGEYHSQAGAFFLGELASATAAGVLDSTINRNQNALGNYVQEPSLSNSAKNGAVTALSRTADRMADGVRQAPEFTEIEGYQAIQVIVQEDPTEIN